MGGTSVTPPASLCRPKCKIVKKFTLSPKKKKMSKRVRPFTFTNFDLSRDDDWYQAFMRQHRATYLCYGVEVCPKTDRMHHQGYLYFQDCKTKSSVIKKLKPNHVEICEGTVEQNITYCSKDGDFHEFGERPVDNGQKKILLMY